jgi:hypothetical protein
LQFLWIHHGIVADKISKTLFGIIPYQSWSLLLGLRMHGHVQLLLLLGIQASLRTGSHHPGSGNLRKHGHVSLWIHHGVLATQATLRSRPDHSRALLLL